MGTLLQDFKYGFRLLRKNPGFAAAAILVLALGIGANTAIFSLVNAVLLRPLPLPEPDRLMLVWHVPPAKIFPGVTRFSVSPANYLDWQKQNHIFEKMAALSRPTMNLAGGSQPESLTAGAATADFFSVTKVAPVLGRVFGTDEDQPGRENVVVLSYGFWQSHFGSNRNALGQKLTLDGQVYTVIGVMPPTFDFPPNAQLWVPLVWTDKDRAVRGNHSYIVDARLAPGVDVKQAQAEMDTISSRLQQQYPVDDAGWGAVVVPLREQLVGRCAPGPAGAAGGGRIRVADCVRECSESHAGKDMGPAKGDRDSHGPGRKPLARAAPGAVGNSFAVAGWGLAGRVSRAVYRFGDCREFLRRPAAFLGNRCGQLRACFHAVDFYSHRRHRRVRAGLATDENEFE